MVAKVHNTNFGGSALDHSTFAEGLSGDTTVNDTLSRDIRSTICTVGISAIEGTGKKQDSTISYRHSSAYLLLGYCHWGAVFEYGLQKKADRICGAQRDGRSFISGGIGNFYLCTYHEAKIVRKNLLIWLSTGTQETYFFHDRHRNQDRIQ